MIPGWQWVLPVMGIKWMKMTTIAMYIQNLWRILLPEPIM